MSADQPRRLGRYELLEVLGHGAMGVVYKAQDAFLDRVVAVKTYRQDVPITDDIKRRFDREVRTASKLVHPNIVVVLDGGLEQGVPYLAMEFVDGPTLAAELMRRGRLPISEALSILLEVADGLTYAHARGVVHRDLKPANILLSGGHAKIADFGVAKLMSAGTAVTTTPVGTPSYMAPEQIEGRSIDARTDVFALAILSYELLTGKAPFAGEGWTQVLYQIMNVDPQPATSVDPTLPPTLDVALGNALAKDPTKRTPDVRTLVAELRDAFSAPLSAATRPEAPARRASSGPPPAPPSVPPPPPSEDPSGSFEMGEFDAFRELAPKKQPSSPMGPAIFVVVMLALLLGVIAYHRLMRHAPTTVPPVAMATAAPAAPTPAEPTPAPAPFRAPAEAPTEAPRARATEAPRPRPTEVPRPKPTEEPRPEPTAVPRPTAPPRPTAAPVPTMRPTAAPVPTMRRVEPVAPPAESAPAAPEVATGKPTIDVISDPPGADVSVNGRAKGRTPLRIADLDPGSYEFEISKGGYNTYRKSAALEAESDYTMKVTLPLTVNSLRVLSQPPGVTIKMNGELKGRTPITVGSLPSGHYDVTAELEGFTAQTMGVELKDGELQEVRFTFGTK